MEGYVRRSLLVVGIVFLLRAEGSASCTIPLQPTKTGFTAAVRIGGHGPFRFLVDTAATQTVLTPALAGAAGIERSGTVAALTTSGPLGTESGTARNVSIGDLTVERLPVLIVALPEFKSHGRLDGIVGMDVLKDRSFLLDLRRRCLEPDFDGASLQSGTTIGSHEIVGRVALEVAGLNLVLDSGASFPVLMSPAAQKLAIADNEFELISAGGKQTARSGTIPSLRLGTITLRNLPAAFTRQHDPREDALIPASLFSSIYVDASRRFVILNGNFNR